MDARAEWVKPFPWLTRLREVSPVSETMDFLWPRYREDHEEWWLYRAVPAALCGADRVAQFAKHWSELPVAEQMGRRRLVTEYQFWMWQTHRLDVTPFWILQGCETVVGGTPFSFTDYERRMMEADGYEGAEPIPPATLPQVPFDERAVTAILARDRLVKFQGNLEAMKKANRPEALRAADEVAEVEFRKRYLDFHNQTMKPQAEFWGWFAKKEAAHLPDAPTDLANTLAHWRDDFIKTGVMPSGTPRSRTIR